MRQTLIMLSLLLTTGCSMWMPTRYGEMVYVINEEFKGQTGRMLKDCKGFESYLVELNRNKKRVCIRIWDMEKIYL